MERQQLEQRIRHMEEEQQRRKHERDYDNGFYIRSCDE
jgi:hypothetical protein